ncbi:MAG: fibronectin type III domain-containing protein, partial [Granulosicoccus sp.]|nr:fibronectin type III domain-containing protein [Granulosicoccus sp.]
EQVNVSDGLSFFDEGLMPDTSYIYQVLSYDSEGRRSSAVSIELVTRSGGAGGATSANGPGAVESLSGQVYSSTAVEIFWQPPADADATTVYEVFRDDELVLATDGRSYFDSSLSAGTTYAYAVRAVSGDGQPGELASVELMTSE